jgi:excisionase family DNA binding protein
MELDRFDTEKELAELLRCSRPAIRLWRKQGLPSRRFGRLVRFDRRAVLAWFESRERAQGDAR